MGDIHGSYKALMQVLKKSKFDYKNDRLIYLGDVADGWPNVVESLEELLKIKNLVYIKGNHDSWLQHWLERGDKPDVWTLQGGQNTQNSYFKHPHNLWIKHRKFLKKVPYWFVDEENRVYVHGGLKPDIPVENNEKMFLMWDRTLWDERYSADITQYKEVFIGHTSIFKFSHFPLRQGNIWYMDTGAGWEGVLSIMNVDTKEFWTSDKSQDLYNIREGRQFGTIY